MGVVIRIHTCEQLNIWKTFCCYSYFPAIFFLKCSSLHFSNFADFYCVSFHYCTSSLHSEFTFRLHACVRTEEETPNVAGTVWTLLRILCHRFTVPGEFDMKLRQFYFKKLILQVVIFICLDLLTK